ncbi:hypothetical protein B5M09_013788 [Aphanomyces astaci]|uniref:Uncharacterized protein n=1 Tax=Aphanomyces astaci TaxID=112090 RepID=A0A3R7Z6D2_APHAT|nr:hypothetical protein B5M09_013788 [Aphanomyces astaci]
MPPSRERSTTTIEGAKNNPRTESTNRCYTTQIRTIVQWVMAHGRSQGVLNRNTLNLATPHRHQIGVLTTRAGWSLGDVLDRYIHYAPAGDQYASRIASRLPESSTALGTQPPHFGARDDPVMSRMEDIFEAETGAKPHDHDRPSERYVTESFDACLGYNGLDVTRSANATRPT